MSKERLESIENTWHTPIGDRFVSDEDIEWLIEQAERVEELEDDKEYLHELIDKTAKRLENLIEQNKRYREAIEKAKSESAHRIGDKTIIKIYEILEEALEGES